MGPHKDRFNVDDKEVSFPHLYHVGFSTYKIAPKFFIRFNFYEATVNASLLAVLTTKTSLHARCGSMRFLFHAPVENKFKHQLARIELLPISTGTKL